MAKYTIYHTVTEREWTVEARDHEDALYQHLATVHGNLVLQDMEHIWPGVEPIYIKQLLISIEGAALSVPGASVWQEGKGYQAWEDKNFDALVPLTGNPNG